MLIYIVSLFINPTKVTPFVETSRAAVLDLTYYRTIH